MGKMSRSKGSRGQTAAKHLLQDRDWQVIPTSAGYDSEDFCCLNPQTGGALWAVEVKMCKLIDIPKFVRQAQQQAKRRKAMWMLMCHVHGTKSWLVMRQGDKPTIWEQKV